MQRFRIVMADGQPIWPNEIARASHPELGDEIVMFNYPDIVRFVVERFDRRRDCLPNDGLKPLQAVLRRVPIGRKTQAPREPQAADHIAQRLEQGFDQAIVEFPEKTVLHLSRRDFADLCASEGVGEGPRQSFATLSYSGVPIELGEPADKASYFAGFRKGSSAPDDYGVIHITRDDGSPFQIDREILWTAERCLAGVVTRDMAAAKLYELIVPAELSKAGRRTLERIADNLQRIQAHTLSPWMAAQALTDMKWSLDHKPAAPMAETATTH